MRYVRSALNQRLALHNVAHFHRRPQWIYLHGATNDQQGDATGRAPAAPNPDTSAPTGPAGPPDESSDGISGAQPEPKLADTPANPSSPGATGPSPTPPAARGGAVARPFQRPGSDTAREREYHAQQVELFARTAPDTAGHYVRLAAYFGTTPQVVAAYPEDFKLAFETRRYRNSLLSQPAGQNPSSLEANNIGSNAPGTAAIAEAPQQPPAPTENPSGSNSMETTKKVQQVMGRLDDYLRNAGPDTNLGPGDAAKKLETFKDNVRNTLLARAMKDPNEDPTTLYAHALGMSVQWASTGASIGPQHQAPRGQYPSQFHGPLEQISQCRDLIKSTAAKYGVDPQAIASIIFQEKFNGVWADLKDAPAIDELALTRGYFGKERSIGLAEMKVSRAAKLLGLEKWGFKERAQAIGSLLIPESSIDLIARNIAAYQKDIGRPLSVQEATVAHNAGSEGLKSYIKDEIPQAKIDASVYGRSWNYQGAIAKALQGEIDPAPDAR